MKKQFPKGRFSKQEKLDIVALIQSGRAEVAQISARRKIPKNTIRTWLARYTTPAPAAEQPVEAPQGSSSTALVPAGWPIKAQANGLYTEPDRERVLALVDKENMTCAEAAALAGIPVATLYQWRHKRKATQAQQVVLAEPKHAEAAEIEPGVAAVVVAAQQALIVLRQSREARLDAIRTMQSGSNTFTDDFCLSQIALNKLNRVFGMK